MLNSGGGKKKSKNQLHSEKLAQRGTSKIFMPFKVHVPLLPHITSLGFMSHAIAKNKQLVFMRRFGMLQWHVLLGHCLA